MSEQSCGSDFGCAKTLISSLAVYEPKGPESAGEGGALSALRLMSKLQCEYPQQQQASATEARRVAARLNAPPPKQVIPMPDPSKRSPKDDPKAAKTATMSGGLKRPSQGEDAVKAAASQLGEQAQKQQKRANKNNNSSSSSGSTALAVVSQGKSAALATVGDGNRPISGRLEGTSGGGSAHSAALAILRPKPQWHAPWELHRVVAGHMGWVRCMCVDPQNEWYATGSADQTIKVWDLARGTLRLTLTGHVSAVRGLAVSSTMPYLFSVGEDKSVKCWDLETNAVVRHYHGHLSGVYCCALHPTLPLLVTGGRDATVRVWDIRTQTAVHVLEGHSSTVSCVAAQGAEPQVVSGSMDATVRLWDLVAGRSAHTLTHHKKGVRALALHPTDYGMITSSADGSKQWAFPNGTFVNSFAGQNAIVNGVAVNPATATDDIVATVGDNGSIFMWDWKTGYNFQKMQTVPQPGSLDSEAGIYAVAFDRTGLRMFTCEADKTVKVWRQVESATPETHPITDWTPRKFYTHF